LGRTKESKGCTVFHEMCRVRPQQHPLESPFSKGRLLTNLRQQQLRLLLRQRRHRLLRHRDINAYADPYAHVKANATAPNAATSLEKCIRPIVVNGRYLQPGRIDGQLALTDRAFTGQPALAEPRKVTWPARHAFKPERFDRVGSDVRNGCVYRIGRVNQA
jgi:hypothetical protein